VLKERRSIVGKSENCNLGFKKKTRRERGPDGVARFVMGNVKSKETHGTNRSGEFGSWGDEI